MIDTLHDVFNMSTPMFVVMLVAYAAGITLVVVIGTRYQHHKDRRREREVKRTHKGW